MSATDHPEVRISGGTVRGRREDGLLVFRGVPFAQPPVGALRFAAPEPALPWGGVREAAAFGPPPQQSSVLGPDPRGERSGDPDWLTVNLWSPAGGAGLPVMV